MTTAMSKVLNPLDAREISALAHSEGPCVSMQLPDYKPGAGEGTRSAHLRDMTQAAIEQLRNFQLPVGNDRLIQSVAHLMEIPQTTPGGPGMALFCAPGLELAYGAAGIAPELLTVGTRFHILPLLSHAYAAHEVFVLGLGKKHVRLWHYNNGECAEEPLPAGIASGLEAFEGFDKPDHDLENRSTGGPATGTRRKIRFGTMSDRESHQEYLHHFFEHIARGLKDKVGETPLFLIGVHEELAQFRRVAGRLRVFETEWNENAEYCAIDAIAARTKEAAFREYYRLGETAMRGIQEITAKLTGDPVAILRAAHQGRVHRLFVAEQTHMPAHADEGAFAKVRKGEDLANAAVIETLRTSGEVFALPGANLPELPEGSAIAAILRY